MPFPAHQRWSGLLAATALACVVGCGLPGPPLPPSLELPQSVADLTAGRSGNRVLLHWTNPVNNTDGTAIRHPVTAEICRRQASHPQCEVVGSVSAPPGKQQDFADSLPPELLAGKPEVLAYSVRLKNRGGATAGESNIARAASGSATAAISNLQAAYTADGVVLSWNSAANAPAMVRIHRHLLQGPPKAVPDQTLEVESAGDSVLDASAERNARYSYTVQPFVREQMSDAAGAHYLEIAGPALGPVEVTTRDSFPPAPPRGLAAVGGMEQGRPYVDLSWEPNDEPDLAGYKVIRRSANGAAETVTAPPIVSTTFHDSHVAAGGSYSYQVVAIDTSGNQSAPSLPVSETAPQP